MKVEISDHARDRMSLRGATEDEVRAAISEGEPEPAQRSRIMYRRNFVYNSEWSGKVYRTKQVAPVVITEGDRLVVVTVYVFYF